MNNFYEMTTYRYCQRNLGFNEQSYVIKCGKKRVGACCEECYEEGCKVSYKSQPFVG